MEYVQRGWRLFRRFCELSVQFGFLAAFRQSVVLLLKGYAPFWYEAHRYSLWRSLLGVEKRLQREGEAVLKELMATPPLICFLYLQASPESDERNGGGELAERTLASLESSLLPPSHCYIVGRKSLTSCCFLSSTLFGVTVWEEGEELPAGSICFFLTAGDTLSPSAIPLMLGKMQDEGADICYSDQDLLDTEGELLYPCFFPDFSIDLFTARPYFLSFFFLRGSFLQGVSIPSEKGAYDAFLCRFVLAVYALEGQIVHLSEPVFHRYEKSDEWFASSLEVQKCLLGFAESLGAVGVEDGLIFKSFHLRYPLPDKPADDKPLFSVLIPTRDALSFLQRCIESIEKTCSLSYEIIILDHESSEPHCVEFLRKGVKEGRFKTVSCTGDFNFSAFNNRGAEVAKAEMLLFLNNDVEAVEDGWVEAMLEQAYRRDVGAVGGLLLYPDGRIQHGGIILGLYGYADHAFRGLDGMDEGYCGFSRLTRNVSGVSAACMMVEKRKFLEAGGFNEGLFPVDYNDVDLCLRLQGLGYRSVYTPFSRLIHDEMVSRGKQKGRYSRAGAEERLHLQEIWGDALLNDLFYNRHLSRFDTCYDYNFSER